jgi:hypothetical protein
MDGACCFWHTALLDLNAPGAAVAAGQTRAATAAASLVIEQVMTQLTTHHVVTALF